MKRGDLVKWVGGSYHNLQGIVIETREDAIHSSPAHRESHEIKVIWDGKGLGSLKQKSKGSWQRASCLEVISSVEQNDENR
jgi:hypothetical protein|tara:strand:+ start:358 stop:600 length:243 start_codon:yes stop_codon:yes gene_type:complete